MYLYYLVDCFMDGKLFINMFLKCWLVAENNNYVQ